MPARLILTEGISADCSQALPLIDGSEADYLLADKAYDTNEFREAASARGTNPVIPPKSNRKKPRDYDQELYKLWHLVENAFLHLKQWRAVATRYAKESASYLATCQIRSLVLWLKLFCRHPLETANVMLTDAAAEFEALEEMLQTRG